MTETEELSRHRLELAIEMERQPVKGAVLSPARDGKSLFRFALWRQWDSSLDLLGVVMLNPSTADSRQDDHTIRRLVFFAKKHGYGGFVVTNLYAYRATDPYELLQFGLSDAVGLDNDEWIKAACHDREVLVAWGNSGGAPRASHVVDLVRPVARKLLSLGYNNNGSPPHPARLPDWATLVAWPKPADNGDTEHD